MKSGFRCSEKRGLTRQKLFMALGLLVALFALNSCVAISHTYGPYMGKVVDKETNEPIEGAVVFMQFFNNYGTFGGAVGEFADAVEVLTDSNGEFVIPKLTVRPPNVRLLRGWEEYPQVIIFKPGYGAYPRHKGVGPRFVPDYSIPSNQYVTITLPKLKSREERIKNQSDASFTSKIPYGKWENLFRLRNEERKNIGLKPFKEPQYN